VYADRNMLFQAFANIFDNAIKYSSVQGTDAVGIVTLKSKKTPTGFEVTIADNGPGIPEDEFDKVTQRFYRLDQSRNSPGSGLGLALSSAVLRLHNMEMRFSDNTSGQERPGLKVTITPEVE